jgi:hypothetical protein
MTLHSLGLGKQLKEWQLEATMGCRGYSGCLPLGQQAVLQMGKWGYRMSRNDLRDIKI